MNAAELKKLKLPDEPGVYRFVDGKGKILYIGKATSLRDRTRSYFANDLMHTRGKHIVDMVTLAKTLKVTMTDSVLEALILEASLIKKHQPYFNTKEKDDKSFNYVVITKDDFPAVLKIRERTMLSGDSENISKYKYAFGPFAKGGDLALALNIVRHIFPYRDTCNHGEGKPCFNRQIGLCPGVCSGEISRTDYAATIRSIKDFFEGKKQLIIKRLEKEMHECAKELRFEEAGDSKRKIFALRHIKDSSLIREEIREHSISSSSKRAKAYRIEAYDISHISGTHTVGVMVVVEDGRPKKSDFRMFKVRVSPNEVNDPLHLKEVLERRFQHKEWPLPDLVVIDGATAQKRVAERVLKTEGLDIPVIGVVKDDRHKPKALLGSKELAESYKRGILIANAESHRFAVAYHRKLRDKIKK